MFVLRCGFWLSVVYAGILFPQAPYGRHLSWEPAEAGATLRGAAVSAVSATVPDPVGYCRAHTSACMNAAGQLTALIDKVQAGGEAGILTDDKAKPASAVAPGRPSKKAARSG